MLRLTKQKALTCFCGCSDILYCDFEAGWVNRVGLLSMIVHNVHKNQPAYTCLIIVSSLGKYLHGWRVSNELHEHCQNIHTAATLSEKIRYLFGRFLESTYWTKKNSPIQLDSFTLSSLYIMVLAVVLGSTFSTIFGLMMEQYYKETDLGWNNQSRFFFVYRWPFLYFPFPSQKLTNWFESVLWLNVVQTGFTSGLLAAFL